MKIFKRLGGRIFITFAMSLMLLAMFFGGLSAHFGRQMVIHSSSNELRVLSVVLSQLIQKQFSSLEANLDTVTENSLVLGSIEYGGRTRKDLEAYLQDQKTRLPFFEDIMIYGLDGKCIGATDPDWYKIDGKGYRFFKEGLEEFGFPSIYGTDSAGKVQLASSPITNGKSHVVGVVVAIIRLNAVYELMDQKIGLSETTDAFLVDEDLRFITPGKAGPSELVESHLVSTALKEHVREEYWVGEYNNYNGDKVLGTALKIPGYSWYIVVERKYGDVVRRITAMQQVVLLVTIGLGVIFVITSLLLSRSITQPILQLVESARGMGEGNLHIPVTIPRQIEEVEFLGAEFERMRRRLAQSQDLLKERLEVSEALRVESERLAAIGTLASSLAHEIRNPLNAMNLLLSRLDTMAQEEQRRTVIHSIFGEIGRLDRLVNSILDYAKPLQLDRTSVDLILLVESVVGLYRPLLNERKVFLILDFDAKSLVISLDQDRIRQCLVNLIQNALDAMPDGGRLTIAVRSFDEYARIEIADSGSGIPVELHRKLFSLFFTTKQTGTGLGLSNVQKIVMGHGGSIDVISDPAKAALGEAPAGTRFVVILPR